VLSFADAVKHALPALERNITCWCAATTRPAFPVVTTAAQRCADTAGTTLIAMTVNELRRPFDALLLRPLHGRRRHAGMVSTAPKTP
jgi:hypothetical protein